MDEREYRRESQGSDYGENKRLIANGYEGYEEEDKTPQVEP